MLHQARLILAVGLLAGPLVSTLVATPARAADVVTLAPVTDKDYAAKVLQARKGKAVLVQFWASYCTPCLAEIPALLEVQKRVQKRGGDVVFVSVDPPGDPAQIQKVAALKKLPPFASLQVANDDPQHFIDAVDKKWMGEVPFAAVYGKDGKLRKTLSGEQKVQDLEKALQEAL